MFLLGCYIYKSEVFFLALEPVHSWTHLFLYSFFPSSSCSFFSYLSNVFYEPGPNPDAEWEFGECKTLKNNVMHQRKEIGLKGLWYTDRKHIIIPNKVYVFIYLVTSLIVTEDVSI